jgi:hypothetical protein
LLLSGVRECAVPWTARNGVGSAAERKPQQHSHMRSNLGRRAVALFLEGNLSALVSGAASVVLPLRQDDARTWPRRACVQTDELISPGKLLYKTTSTRVILQSCLAT